MLTVERLAYFLALAPFLAGYLARPGAEWTAAAVTADTAIACIILALVLLIRRTRRLTARIDSLRKTMNEAIIHDLKNPMTSIMGCLSCALEDELNAEQRKKMLNIALLSCRAQMTLLETLVDTNRLERGELTLQRKSLNARRLVELCLDEVSGAARYLGVTLENRISPDIPQRVFADPDLLPRVLSNLLHNALKYTPPGGLVSVSAAFRDGAFRFEIKDTGVGIDPRHISRLFNKYYRVEGADQASRRGSGLGLYFCRMVVEAHEGAISVTSEVGRGTAVAFSIPQTNATGDSSHDTIRQPHAEQPASGAR